MTATRSRPLLVDLSPSDPSAALAARYMRSHLDQQIGDRADVNYAGAPSEELRELLHFRYGAALADVTKESGERWADAVARASASAGRQVRAGVEAYAVEWDESAAIQWFRREVQRRWPAAKVEAAFLAADPVTLWTVCLALDLAPHRAAKFADDPFPAPPLLITGPTGIGKELLAKAVHAASGAPGPLGAINCGGLPTQLLESELFGHEKGAFTGAVKSKRGLVEEFERGTLFLDEVGDMPAEVQVRLLRFLNDGEARKVGANQSYKAFPRIIAATHVDLAARAESGHFRRDLLHRLRGRHLHLRGLAERPQASLTPVVQQFLTYAAEARGERPPRLTAEVYVAMMTHAWPGNMRELKYVVERLFNEGARTSVVGIEALPDEIIESYFTRTKAPVRDVLSIVAARDRGEPHDILQTRLKLSLGERFEQHEKRTDTRAGSLRQAASVLTRIGAAFGVEAAAKPYIDVLHWAAQEALAEEFQTNTLEELRSTARQMQIDIEEAVAMYQELTDDLRSQAHKGTAKLQASLRQSEKRYAAAALIASAVRVAQQSESKLVLSAIKFAESVLEFAATPPFAEAAKQIGTRVGAMSPREAREVVREFFESPAASEGDPALTWKKVRGDAAALEAVVEDAGSVTDAAKRLAVRPETVSRTLSELRRNAGKKRQGRAGQARRKGKRSSG